MFSIFQNRDYRDDLVWMGLFINLLCQELIRESLKSASTGILQNESINNGERGGMNSDSGASDPNNCPM